MVFVTVGLRLVIVRSLDQPGNNCRPEMMVAVQVGETVDKIAVRRVDLIAS